MTALTMHKARPASLAERLDDAQVCSILLEAEAQGIFAKPTPKPTDFMVWQWEADRAHGAKLPPPFELTDERFTFLRGVKDEAVRDYWLRQFVHDHDCQHSGGVGRTIPTIGLSTYRQWLPAWERDLPLHMKRAQRAYDRKVRECRHGAGSSDYAPEFFA